MKLSETDEMVIVSALRIAAEQYVTDAANMRLAGMFRTEQQFLLQRTRALALAERLEEEGVEA